MWIQLLLFFFLHAAEDCPLRDSNEVSMLNSVVSETIKGQNGIKTVEDFIAALPVEMRKQHLFLGASESLQKSDPDHPRVLLKTTYAGAVVSFGTHENLPGFNSIEMIQWNPTSNTFELQELTFGTNGEQPKLEKNPKKCLQCHQNPPRPNWDTYNFWAQGLMPFNKDRVYKDCKGEYGLVENLYKKVTNKEPRFASLVKPIMSGSSIELSNGSHDGEGHAINLFDDLTRLNMCRISSEIQKHPKYDKFKYAAMAALNGCDPIGSFLPESMNEEVKRFFTREGVVGENPSEVASSLLENTRAKQGYLFQQKQQKMRDYFSKVLGSASAGQQAMQCSQDRQGIEDREQSSSAVSGLRYVLEPLGIDMRKWSMSVDPSSYTFADQFNLSSTEAFSRVYQEFAASGSQDMCTWLKQKSLAGLNDEDLKNALAMYGCSCEGVESTAIELSALNKGLVDVAAKKIFDKYQCQRCHVGSFGVPTEIPFDDMNKLSAFLKSEPKIATSIVKYLKLPDGHQMRMPQKGPRVQGLEVSAIEKYVANLFIK